MTISACTFRVMYCTRIHHFKAIQARLPDYLADKARVYSFRLHPRVMWDRVLHSGGRFMN